MTQGATRFENPGRQQQQPDKDWSRWAIENIAGTYDDILTASAKLREAARECHLIGGAAIPCIPEGHELQVTVIPVDVAECYSMNKRRDDDRPDARPQQGPPRFGIPKHVLMRIASAAGAEWVESKRIDKNNAARFVHWRVVLRYPLVDGTFRYVEGDKDCDYRDGSDQLAGKTEKEVPKLRENMVRATITKAKLRAIREAFGIAHGMTEAQLERPFVVAKAVFTGRSKDKENARMFARVIAQKQLMAANALYGGGHALLGPSVVKAALPAARPVPIDSDPDLVADDDGVVIESPPESGPVATAPDDEPQDVPPAPPPPPPPPPPVKAEDVPPTVNYVPRIGRSKGKPLADAPDDDLLWLAGVLEQNANDPDKARWRKEALGGLGAVRLELKRRGIEEPPAQF